MPKRLVTNKEAAEIRVRSAGLYDFHSFASASETRALLTTVKVLREGLEDALDGMRDMRPYVFEYFAEKWDHDAYIRRAEELLAQLEGTEKL